MLKFTTLLGICLLLSGILCAQKVDNGGFESAVMIAATGQPENWSMDGVGARYDTDAHSGSRALKIWNWYFWAPGWGCYGEGHGAYDCSGRPISANPTGLKGWYKYVYGENADQADSALCIVALYAGEGTSDTVAYVRHLLGPADKYTPFTVNIPHADRKANTLVIQFISSVRGKCAQQSKGNCLYLTVDDIEVWGESGNADVLNFEPTAQLVVVEATRNFLIQTNDPAMYPCQVTLYDSKGQKVLCKTVDSHVAKGTQTQLAKGLYNWEILAKSGKKYSGAWNLQ